MGSPPEQYPPAPPPEPPGQPDGRPPPAALRPVIVLLLVNLGLSILLTIAVLVARRSVVDYQLAHRHVTDPATRATIRASYSASLIGRVIGNVVVSVVYAFLVRALLRGRRWAYRRVILLGAFGIVALGVLLASPYPSWMKAEQGLQALVLAALLYFVLRPEVRSHFARRPSPA
jgi:ABC-type sulfate transport system permease component